MKQVKGSTLKFQWSSTIKRGGVFFRVELKLVHVITQESDIKFITQEMIIIHTKHMLLNSTCFKICLTPQTSYFPMLNFYAVQQ